MNPLRDKKTGKALAKALGDELRRARETKGLSRAQFVALLPSGIGERTLLAYEHGLRQLTVARLAELCDALDIDPPGTFAHALQRASLYLDKFVLRVDLNKMLADRDNKFRPLFPWARNRLNEVTDGVADVTPDAVHELATFIGQKHSDVANFLARFTPENLPEHHEPAAEATDYQ